MLNDLRIREDKMDFDFNNLQDIKLFTFFYVNEHDNLTKNEKLQILDFVKEANINQMKHLILTGQMTNDKEASLMEVDSYSYYLGKDVGHMQGVGQGVLAGMAAAAVVALATVAARKIYKNYLSNAAKACSKKSGIEKENCMQKFKKAAQKAKITELQKGLSKCPKSKDPTTCKSKLNINIAKEKAKMGEL